MSTAMSPVDLIGEIERQQERIKKPSTIVDVKKELADNIYPLLRLAIESMATLDGDLRERITLAEGVIAEYLTSQESMLLPELAARIQGRSPSGCSSVTWRPAWRRTWTPPCLRCRTWPR